MALAEAAQALSYAGEREMVGAGTVEDRAGPVACRPCRS